MIKTFSTFKGTKVPAITTEQMREVDRIAIEETGPNLFQMMENAGRNLAGLTIEKLGKDWRGAKIVVLAGLGGNGGGGICAGRHLANRGVDVSLCLTEPEKLGEVPAFQRHVFQNAFGREVSFEELQGIDADIILDAVIGYSLKGAPRGNALKLIEWANKNKSPILSLDVPSGVDSTTGQTPGKFIKATWTLTLALPKTGLLPELTGELFLADIGIPVGTYKKMNLSFISPFEKDYRIQIKAEN